VAGAHRRIQDGVAGLDRTIRTVLEVSRDLREMTGSLVGAFAWFDELTAQGGAIAQGPAGVIEEPESPAGELQAAIASTRVAATAPAGASAEGEGGTGPRAETAQRRETWESELASVIPDEPPGYGQLPAVPPTGAEGEAEEPAQPAGQADSGNLKEAEEPQELEELQEPAHLGAAADVEILDDLSGPDLDELGAPDDRSAGAGDELQVSERAFANGSLAGATFANGSSEATRSGSEQAARAESNRPPVAAAGKGDIDGTGTGDEGEELEELAQADEPEELEEL
jgi:hypothetical protein